MRIHASNNKFCVRFTLNNICVYIYIHTYVHTFKYMIISEWSSTTGCRRLTGSPKLQIIFHKRATKYRSILKKMTYKDKGSYQSSPPCRTRCIHNWYLCVKCIHTYRHTREQTNAYTNMRHIASFSGTLSICSII